MMLSELTIARIEAIPGVYTDTIRYGMPRVCLAVSVSCVETGFNFKTESMSQERCKDCGFLYQADLSFEFNTDASDCVIRLCV